MKIVLLGYMGSGKSSVGFELATKLGYKFIDLDNYIELLEGSSISDLFKRKGEIYFRKKENHTLKSLLDSEENAIISTGGGTPCYGDTMEYLTSGDRCITIFLKTSLEVLSDRLFSEKESRPLIAHIEDKITLTDFIRKHLFERLFYYNQAELIIETNEASVESVVEKIVAKLF
jgi:shikimate kinase